jgi:hypothetical protein
LDLILSTRVVGGGGGGGGGGSTLHYSSHRALPLLLAGATCR